MEIVVVSDTHGDLEKIYQVIDANPNAELYLHAGDSCVIPQILPLFRAVKGNCDIGYDYPEELTIKTSYGDIFITHGHKYFNISPYLVKSKDVKLFIFGHTHKKCLEQIDNTYILNPGSLTRPRDDDKGSYAVIELDENKCEIIFKYL